jgi:hypothetical protein
VKIVEKNATPNTEEGSCDCGHAVINMHYNSRKLGVVNTFVDKFVTEVFDKSSV